MSSDSYLCYFLAKVNEDPENSAYYAKLIFAIKEKDWSVVSEIKKLFDKEIEEYEDLKDMYDDMLRDICIEMKFFPTDDESAVHIINTIKEHMETSGTYEALVDDVPANALYLTLLRSTLSMPSLIKDVKDFTWENFDNIYHPHLDNYLAYIKAKPVVSDDESSEYND
jgi:hypothetical protein